jgi:16S rRNA (guanine(966)-N(2))-methyltransferase RsmD
MGHLRIIAGDLKGRRIHVPEAPGVRPTGDRAREALFSILGGRFSGGRVLDAFAGSGALGFEALSRGMDEAVFVEADPVAARTVQANAVLLGLASRCRVHAGRVERLLQGGGLSGPFALVLADPPWTEHVGEGFLAALEASGVLGVEARVVLERDARADAPRASAAFRRLRTAIYGRTALDLLVHVDEAGGSEG